MGVLIRRLLRHIINSSDWKRPSSDLPPEKQMTWPSVVGILVRRTRNDQRGIDADEGYRRTVESVRVDAIGVAARRVCTVSPVKSRLRAGITMLAR